MNQPIPAVFPVVTRELEVISFQGHGSAFFIDPNGLFITAAHTFKDPFKHRYALINGERFEITRIWSEYTDFDCQRPGIYLDLFIGRIENFSSPDFYELIPATKDIPTGEELELQGYKKQAKAPVPLKNETIIDIMDLHEDVISDDYQGTLSQEEEKALQLQLTPIVAIYLKQGFQHINKHSEMQDEFLNGFSIRIEADEPHGHSGGPLLFNGKVAGMLIGQNAAISADYINNKLKCAFASTILANKDQPEMAVKENAENFWLKSLISSVHEKLNKPGSRYESEWKNLSFVSSEDIGALANKPAITVFSGPALTQSNYSLDNSSKTTHLIMINPNVCKEAKFTLPELEAVVMHEIGHILNMSEEKPRPRFPVSTDAELLAAYFKEKEAVDEENRLNNELYADEYVRQQGYHLPLISSMEKYLSLPSAENMNLMHKRMEYLKNAGKNEDLMGKIKFLR